MLDISIDMETLDKVEEFITNDKTVQFMLGNTTDIAVSAFILEVVIKEVNKAREELAAAGE